MFSPVLKVLSWKHSASRVHLGTFFTGLQPSRFYHLHCSDTGAMLQPRQPARTSSACWRKRMSWSFSSFKPLDPAYLCCPEFPDSAIQAQIPLSPSALSPQICTCLTNFLDISSDFSALDTFLDMSSVFSPLCLCLNWAFLPDGFSSSSLSLWQSGPPKHISDTVSSVNIFSQSLPLRLHLPVFWTPQPLSLEALHNLLWVVFVVSLVVLRAAQRRAFDTTIFPINLPAKPLQINI